MIKEKLKYNKNFYFETSKGKVNLTTLNLIDISNSITKQKNGFSAEDIIVDNHVIKCEFKSYNPHGSFLTITIDGEFICSTEEISKFETFANHGTLEMYESSEF